MHPTPFGFPATRRARIEVIPLIDVIFFLLATFVLFTLSQEKIRSLDVTLPGSEPDLMEPTETLFLQMSAAGSMYWKLGIKGTPELINESELRPRLEAYRRSAPVPRVFIRGDRLATFGPAIHALDEVRRMGIEQVSIETVPSPTGG